MINIDATNTRPELNDLVSKPVHLNLSFQAKNADEMSAILYFLASSIEDIVVSLDIPWEPKKDEPQ